MSHNQCSDGSHDDVSISVEVDDKTNDITDLQEEQSLEQVQKRTLSHWPHASPQFITEVMAAGFYGCNDNDRLICPCCDLICENWIPYSDDPCEVHRVLSPDCEYVNTKLMNPTPPPPPFPIINTNLSPTVNVATPPQNVLPSINLPDSEVLVPKASHNLEFAEVNKRKQSFNEWPTRNSQSVDDLARAGFFYTASNDRVKCFYCNGSLDSHELDVEPMIQHAFHFPQCLYARQLCGDTLYRMIERSRCQQQECYQTDQLKEKYSKSRSNMNNLTINRQLQLPNESTLSRLVAARLNLPISQWLLKSRTFNLEIIRECWESQLRIKEEDFVSDLDLLVACEILKKQINYIRDKKENIIIPRIKMRQIRQTREVQNSDGIPTITSFNPCIICLTEEKQVACLPCGHLATCVPCGHSLQSCSICRCEIKAFVRIYI